MTIAAEVLELVRQRAGCACEYCGVSETDAGGQLTIDHFQPQAHEGSDDPDNLLYCCFRCNLYKVDYWPAGPDDPLLWNPRREPFATHFVALADGTLYPITPTGEFTLRRLRLNRPPLVGHRRRRQAQAEELRLLKRYDELLDLLERLHQQQITLLEEHHTLLEEHRTLLALMRKDRP